MYLFPWYERLSLSRSVFSIIKVRHLLFVGVISFSNDSCVNRICKCFLGMHGTEVCGIRPYIASVGLKPVACNEVAW